MTKEDSKGSAKWFGLSAALALTGTLLFVATRPAVHARPSEAAFVGTWTLDASSLPSVEKRMGRKPAAPKLVLEADGTATAVELPFEDGASRQPPFSLITGKGHWKLVQQQDWVVTLAFDGMRSETLDTDDAALTYAVGDPDSNERWIWRKSK